MYEKTNARIKRNPVNYTKNRCHDTGAVPVFVFAQRSKIVHIFIRAGNTHTSYNQDSLWRLENTQTHRGKQKAHYRHSLSNINTTDT